MDSVNKKTKLSRYIQAPIIAIQSVLFTLSILVLNLFIKVRVIVVHDRFGQMISQINNYFVLKNLGIIGDSLEILVLSRNGIYNSFLKRVYTRKYPSINSSIYYAARRLFGKRIFRENYVDTDEFHFEYIKDNHFKHTNAPTIF